MQSAANVLHRVNQEDLLWRLALVNRARSICRKHFFTYSDNWGERR